MTITAKFSGRCSICAGQIAAGEQVEWDRATRTIRHEGCDAPEEPTVFVAVEPEFPPTDEQIVALEKFATGESLAIEAGAGTGKTSTLILLAQSTRRRGQYIAFNKAIVKEARTKFPGNVNCSTAHSLAYANATPVAKHRLANSRRMHSDEIARKLRIEAMRFANAGVTGEPKMLSAKKVAGITMETITRFCQSADSEPIAAHVPIVKGLDAPGSYANNNEVSRYVLPFARRAWADLMSDTGTLPYKHDHYLKAWQLSGPRIESDFILFDEAQDANPVMVAIVAAQTHSQLVWVGDSQQQIYSFTGAVNALGNVPAEQRAFLTQSFRFGDAVADVANELLDRLDADLRVRGWDQIFSAVVEVDDPDAILCRTNATAVRAFLTAMADGLRPHLVGGGKQIVSFARAAQDLMRGSGTEHPDLACFQTWAEVKLYVDEDEQGGELQLLVKLIEDFGIETIIDALEDMVDEAEADVTVSTAHKAKGREWNAVRLAGDFPDQAEGEELRLLYVAVTRAKFALDISAVAALEGGAAFEAA
jgi:superfamily I DNA/RNA helicase